MGVVNIPYLWVCDLNIGGNTLFLVAGHPVAGKCNGVLKNRMSVRVGNAHTDVRCFVLCAVGEFYRGADVFVVAGCDIERMPVEEDVLWCADDADVTEQTATGVPAGIVRLACIGNHFDKVVLADFQLVGHIDFKAHITVVRAANVFLIQIDIGSIHDSFEIQQDALAFQLCRWGIVQPVVAFSHFLKTTTRQTALDIGGDIRIVGFLVGGGRNPRLFYLEVVRHIDLSPFALIIKSELPSEVQTLYCPLRHAVQHKTTHEGNE